MSLSGISSYGTYGGYALQTAHGPNCQCPACQQSLASAATPVAAAAASGNRADNTDAASKQTDQAKPNAARGIDGKPLDEQQQKQVEELKARDSDVRQHEQAHLAAGGALAGGGATYSYQQGPDGKQYAIGGEVSIRLARGSTPQETIANAQTVQRAALAPADPSGQDRSVAAAAAQMEQQARIELMQQQAGKQGMSPLQARQKINSPEQQGPGLGSNIDTYA
ncbi:putative metalloprotease CJM1_0395 family protein [Chromobacterium sp.]|uniref:putative metalloprotease CJM1_0395 family protein n=1 Tax=Chromobacterium sp. TaxID=306190 RepID=UPI0035B0BBF2